MTKQTTEEYTLQRAEGQINWFNKKSTSNKKYYQRIRIAEITLSAAIPVLITYSGCYATVAAWLSVLLAILLGFQTTYKYHEHWIQYRSTAEALITEKHLYQTSSGKYAAEQTKETIFNETIESIIANDVKTWRQTNIKTDEKKPQASTSS